MIKVFLRGLNKGQKKEIYFGNKAQIFSCFLLILMHVLHHAKESKPQRGPLIEKHGITLLTTTE